MSVPNFSSLARLEVAEKFLVVVGWVVEHLDITSNSNSSNIWDINAIEFVVVVMAVGGGGGGPKLISCQTQLRLC